VVEVLLFSLPFCLFVWRSLLFVPPAGLPLIVVHSLFHEVAGAPHLREG
jgi:hypothetical protein